MATEKFVFCAMSPSSCISDSGKASNRKRPSHFARSSTAAWRIMRISQNSSAFGDVRCVISACERDRELQEASAKHSAHAGVRCTQMVKVHAAPGDAEEIILRLGLTTTFKFDDNCFCLCHCVSVADRMQFFADAPLSPNMRTQMYERLVAADPPSAAY